jgi:hypothetical protein
MKRCLRCDFIYEDDQSLCDLDGGELVAQDTAALPPPETTAPRPAIPAARARRKVFAVVLPVAGVVFAAALFLIYHALPDRAVPRDTDQSPVTFTSPPQPEANLISAPTPAASAALPAPPRATETKATRRAHPTPGRPPVDSRPPLPKKEEKKEEKRVEPEAASRQRESKLGSILKKTGHFLKKPFKF